MSPRSSTVSCDYIMDLLPLTSRMNFGGGGGGRGGGAGGGGGGQL